MAEGVRHRQQEVHLHAPLPHLHPGLAKCALAEQRRLGVQFLEIAADGDGFGQDGPVVELENGKPLKRIALGDLLRAMPHRAHVDRNQRHVDALLREEDANPARVRRAASVIELHEFLPVSFRRDITGGAVRKPPYAPKPPKRPVEPVMRRLARVSLARASPTVSRRYPPTSRAGLSARFAPHPRSRRMQAPIRPRPG